MTTSSATEHPADNTGDRDVPPGPGDMPSQEEEKAADRAAQTAPDVSKPYKEMNERGANAQGEGQIED